jgi:hypothetical protein
MRKRLTAAGAVTQETMSQEAAVQDAESDGDDLQGEFRAKFGRFAAVRRFLVDNRIRVHLISGIEFMMFVFIVGPVIDQLVLTTVVISLGMIAFELLLIYKLWTNTKSFSRRLAKLEAANAAAETSSHQALESTPA